ncbi:MAG: tRNA pseudouridine(38-40) synthase TruA [Clostridia bacterium]|nr:tRNA pseudouridine(38-40) synthase TruA [Clostridia bacterium]
MRYKLTVAYVGKNFSGWQSQKDVRTAQDELEKGLSQLLGETIVVHAAGRTDEGVSAIAQTVHFDTQKEMLPFSLVQAVNFLLPDDLSVINAEVVDKNFHARKSAIKKTYVYRLYVSAHRHAVYDTFATQIYKMPDLNLMKQVAQKLIGEHDFKAFSSTGSSAKTTIRTIESIDIIQKGNLLEISICGNAFLYNMVRIIVGTLIWIGLGKLPQDTVDKMLQTGNRKLGAKTFPAVGLRLEDIQY